MTEEKKKKAIQAFRLLDDTFMRMVFAHDTEVTQDVLRVIMRISDLEVTEVTPQTEIKSMGGKSIQLDIFARDSTGTFYNVEIQRDNKGASPKRARYNLGQVDGIQLKEKQDPTELADVCVIFITEHDVFKKGAPIYCADRILSFCTTEGMQQDEFQDGSHIIYVNCAYPDDGTALGALISDFRQTDPDKIQMESLRNKVRYFKESEEGHKLMCRVVEEIFKDELQEGRMRARQEGRQEGRQEEFFGFIKTCHEENWSISKMAKFTHHSEEDVISALNELGLSILN